MVMCLFPSPAAELGDHCLPRLPGYLSKCHFLPEQDEDFLSKVEDLHPQHKYTDYDIHALFKTSCVLQMVFLGVCEGPAAVCVSS